MANEIGGELCCFMEPKQKMVPMGCNNPDKYLIGYSDCEQKIGIYIWQCDYWHL